MLCEEERGRTKRLEIEPKNMLRDWTFTDKESAFCQSGRNVWQLSFAQEAPHGDPDRLLNDRRVGLIIRR